MSGAQCFCNEGQKDCVAVQSTVCCNESNLSYCTKICGAYTKTMEQTLRDYGVMECGVLARGLKKNCSAFNLEYLLGKVKALTLQSKGL